MKIFSRQPFVLNPTKFMLSHVFFTLLALSTTNVRSAETSQLLAITQVSSQNEKEHEKTAETTIPKLREIVSKMIANKIDLGYNEELFGQLCEYPEFLAEVGLSQKPESVIHLLTVLKERFYPSYVFKTLQAENKAVTKDLGPRLRLGSQCVQSVLLPPEREPFGAKQKQDFIHQIICKFYSQLLAAHKPLAQFSLNKGANTIVISSDLRYMFISSNMGHQREVNMYDLNALLTNKVAYITKFSYGTITPYSVKISACGTYLLTGGDGIIRLWSVPKLANNHRKPDGARLKALPSEGSATLSANFSPNGKYVSISNFDGNVMVYDLEQILTLTSNPERALVVNICPEESKPIAVTSFSPCGQYLLASCNNGITNIWNIQNLITQAETGQVKNITHKQAAPHLVAKFESNSKNPSSSAFSPHGNLVITTSNKALYIWDFKTLANKQQDGEVIPIAKVLSEGLYFSYAFSPCQRYLLIGDGKKTMHLYDVPTLLQNPSNQARAQIFEQAFDKEIKTVSYSPNGDFFCIGTSNFCYILPSISYFEKKQFETINTLLLKKVTN
ncbi:MAG: hypothetical protein H6679_00845 [Epsilonproteobacteria bacterium]|nr:hypothetical protein [Campylobacterota bacterium]